MRSERNGEFPTVKQFWDKAKEDLGPPSTIDLIIYDRDGAPPWEILSLNHQQRCWDAMERLENLL
jgi:hypothetical protein